MKYSVYRNGQFFDYGNSFEECETIINGNFELGGCWEIHEE